MCRNGFHDWIYLSKYFQPLVSRSEKLQCVSIKPGLVLPPMCWVRSPQRLILSSRLFISQLRCGPECPLENITPPIESIKNIWKIWKISWTANNICFYVLICVISFLLTYVLKSCGKLKYAWILSISKWSSSLSYWTHISVWLARFRTFWSCNLSIQYT